MGKNTQDVIPLIFIYIVYLVTYVYFCNAVFMNPLMLAKLYIR